MVSDSVQTHRACIGGGQAMKKYLVPYQVTLRASPTGALFGPRAGNNDFLARAERNPVLQRQR